MLKDVKQFVVANEKTGWLRFINLLPTIKTITGNEKVPKKQLLPFTGGIKITARDRTGLIHEITRVISSDMNLKIKSFHLETHDGSAEAEVDLIFTETSQMDKLLHDLNRIDGIKKVNRNK
jgi:(p)ppGpp synthase/HD superfamily hydrolase